MAGARRPHGPARIRTAGAMMERRLALALATVHAAAAFPLRRRAGLDEPR